MRPILGVRWSLHERTGGRKVGNDLVSTVQPFREVDMKI